MAAQNHGHDGGGSLSEAGHDPPVDVAAARDRIARARDLEAQARDLAAHARDLAAERSDREVTVPDATSPVDGRWVTSAAIVLSAADGHRQAATDRAAAADARTRAAGDRKLAARDRELAARDRVEAHQDRDAILHQLAIAETDQLTGTSARAAGLVAVDHEIDRARRTSGLVVVAYVDVVGLKVVNDSRGHAAGDRLLQRAVRGIRGHLRSYDFIVRLGGDEFLCVMPGATIQDARERFGGIQFALRTDPHRCEIKVGFAALAPGDNAAELIERADAELPASARSARDVGTALKTPALA
jgi:diguanylate cyclase (GGDEF)-like protein